MKTTALAGALLTLTVALSPARPFGDDYAEDDADQISRTVVHKDGTYTTTQRDSDASTLVRETNGELGVYAKVTQPGTIREGDEVSVG